MKNVEILIPTWPAAHSRDSKLGLGNSYSMDTCDSLWVKLRSKPLNNNVYEFGDDCRVWSDIGLYVWMSGDYGIKIEVKARELHSGDVAYIEKLLRCLKWVNKRLDGIGEVNRDNLPFWLVDFCKRLGIKRTVRYQHCVDDTIGPVSEALQLLTAEILERHSKCAKYKAA